MIDIKIIAIHDLLPVTGVEIAPINPLALDIIGRNLSQATEILINDAQVEEFIVISGTRIIAQVPASQRNAPIRKLSVMAETPSTDRSSLLRFEVGRTFKRLQGLEKLVQLFVKYLFQTPGTNKFRPNDGGGLLTLIGSSVSMGTSKSLTADVVSSVSRARDQLMVLQNRNPRIPQDERLLSATASGIGFDSNTSSMMLRLEIIAASRQQAVTNLTF